MHRLSVQPSKYDRGLVASKSTPWRSLGALSFFLLMSACTSSSEAPASREDDQTSEAGVTIASREGETVVKMIEISGAQRTANDVLPANCGESSSWPRTVRGGQENFAYVEVKNPTDIASAVSLVLERGGAERVALFAYASPTLPTSYEEARRCLSTDQSSYDSTKGVQLSAETGKALVVPARSSVYVLVATGNREGSFRLSAKTEAFAPSDNATIEVPHLGEAVTFDVLVSGAQRTESNLLPSNFCGKPSADRSVIGGQDNYAYIEVKNPSDTSAQVALSVAPRPSSRTALVAYDSVTPPTHAAEADDCRVTDWSLLEGARLSGVNGKGLVVPARSSVYVLVAIGSGTGLVPLQVSSL